eukprot:562068-Pyramimonas_sp.AAC.1
MIVHYPSDTIPFQGNRHRTHHPSTSSTQMRRGAHTWIDSEILTPCIDNDAGHMREPPSAHVKIIQNTMAL